MYHLHWFTLLSVSLCARYNKCQLIWKKIVKVHYRHDQLITEKVCSPEQVCTPECLYPWSFFDPVLSRNAARSRRRFELSSFGVFYHHLRTLSTALASGVGATNMFDSICRVVSGEKLVQYTERSSFVFHLLFFWWASRSLAQACGSVMAVSWQSNVIVSESLRLSKLQRKPVVVTLIHLSDRFQCRNSLL